MAVWNATATDNCDAQRRLMDQPTLATRTSTAAANQIQIRFIATDRCGLADTCIQLITFVDTIAPTFDCPEDVTLECNNNCKTAALAGDGKAALDCAKGVIDWNVKDACDPQPSVTQVGSRFSIRFARSSLSLSSWRRIVAGTSLTPAYGRLHTSIRQRRVSIAAAPARIACNALWDGVFDGDSLGWPKAADECDATPEISLTGYSTIGEGCPYIIRRAFVAIDTCGNISDTCYQDITVYDEDRPQIACPEEQFFECDVDTTLFAWPKATDSCDVDPTIELILYSKDQIGECSYILVRACTLTTIAATTPIPVVKSSPWRSRPTRHYLPPDTIVECSELVDGSMRDHGQSHARRHRGWQRCKDESGCNTSYRFRYGTPTGTDNATTR